MKNNEDSIKKIIRELEKIDYIKAAEIPDINLYMDQVTTFMDEHLKASKRHDEDKLLTKTMINNYTKNELLPAPNKKKYSKEHMLLLIFIYYFKNFLSISDIQNILNPLTEKFYDKKSDINLQAIYEEVFNLEKDQINTIIKDVIRKSSKSKETFMDAKYDSDREFLQSFSFICLLSFDVYVKKTMIEHLIDETVMQKKPKPKNDTKKADINKQNK